MNSLELTSRKKIHGRFLEMRPSLSHYPDQSKTDIHFYISSLAWRRNKIELFERAGSDGFFEYSAHSNEFSFQSVILGQEFPSPEDFCAPLPFFSSVRSRIDETRNRTTRQQHRVPKELASIQEQSNIPIYLEQRPLRKCRIITSPATT
jgi:hypothetical protein